MGKNLTISVKVGGGGIKFNKLFAKFLYFRVDKHSFYVV